MRILVVQESDWVEVGPHQSHHLMERLSLKGHEVRVIDHYIRWRRQGKGVRNTRTKVDGYHKVIDEAKIDVITPAFIGLPILDYLSIFITHRMEIKKQIKSFKPDVIVGFGILNASSAISLAKRVGVPFVYYIIDELDRLVPQKNLQRFAKFFVMRNFERADRIISINEALQEYCISLGAPGDKTEVVRAGVDLEWISRGDRTRVRKLYGFLEDDVVLFFMGWLYPFSGLDEVVEELAKNKDPWLKMMILGKGELWDKLQDACKRNGMEGKLILEGWKPFSEVPDYLAAADICLLPTKRNKIMENIVPIKMYEYLAAGKVVFATDLYGIRKEFGKGNGVMYVKEPRDVVTMAVKLMHEGRVNEEGFVGKQLMSNSDWSQMVNRFEQALNEVINVQSLQQKGYAKGDIE